MIRRLLALSLVVPLCVVSTDAQATLYTLGTEATAGATFGWSVADAGDVDGDGTPDVVVGCPQESLNGPLSGVVRVYSGATGALIRTWFGETAIDMFGWSVDGLGDVDGDGCSDVLVGAPFFDGLAGPDSGKVYVFSGKTGAILWSQSNFVVGVQAGYCVRGLGDLTGDGVPDFGFGMPGYSSTWSDNGGVVVHGGAIFNFLYAWYGDGPDLQLGTSFDVVESTGVFATNRLILGAPRSDLNGTDSGEAWLVRMGQSGPVKRHIGAWSPGLFGVAVAGVGDVNGDGTPDYAVGESIADANGADSGRVVVYSGTTDLPMTILPGTPGQRLGESLSGLGDYDGDGRDDFLVGAPQDDSVNPNGGFAAVVSGATGAYLDSWSGGASDDLGLGLSRAGDVNGDGAPDLVIGAWGAGANGEAYVITAPSPGPTTYCQAKVNSLGCTPQIGFAGNPSASGADDFHVTAANVLNKKSGLMFWGLGAQAAPFLGGTLCVQPPLRRTTLQYSFGSGQGDDCTGAYDFHVTQAYMASVGIAGGDTLYAQYWSRDPGFAAPFNRGLTDALQFDVAP